MNSLKSQLAAGILAACGTVWASLPPSTGQGSGTDANYKLSAGSAFIVTTRPANWGSQTGAQWIGPAADATKGHPTGDSGNFVFTLSFTASVSTTTLSMSVLCDPDVDIQFGQGSSLSFIANGVSGASGNGKKIALGPIKSGTTYTLKFFLSDIGQGPVGLNVAFSDPSDTGGSLGANDFPTIRYPASRYSADVLADPVDSSSGQFYQSVVDLALGGPASFAFGRYYASGLSSTGFTTALGTNWMSPYDAAVRVNGSTAKVLLLGGKIVTFTGSAGVWSLSSPKDIAYQFAASGGGYQFVDPVRGKIFSFTQAGALTRIADSNGNGITVTQGANGPTQLSDGLGRTLTLTYASNLLASIGIRLDGR